MHPQTTRAELAAMITVLMACVASYSQNRATTTQPAMQPALDPRVDKILTRLEGREIHDLTAEVSWKLRYLIDLDEDAITKRGRIWYQRQEPVPKFLVHFNQKIASNRLHALDERHLFDGRWYVELNSETKTVTRREVRRAGETGNPYKLGEGPFPLPFGQKKADILEEFEVALVPPAEADPPGTDHLKLVPREGTQTARSYKQVDVWVARQGPHHGLPIKVHTGKKSGTGELNSYITITFKHIRLDRGLSRSVFEIKKPRGYHEVVETLDPIAPPPGASANQPKTP